MPARRPDRERADWVVVVPVKGRGHGKSRLGPAGPHRDDLALAFALDTVEAAVACAAVVEVLVVTGDPRVADDVAAAGAAVIAESRSGGDRLNAAVWEGLADARERHPGAYVAALTSDLPTLTPATLAEALERAASHPLAMVPDAAGVGTTMITAGPGEEVAPAFGEGSRARHEAAGHVIVRFPMRSGIRLDVDIQSDLDVAVRLGVGRHSAVALSSAALGSIG